MTGQFTHGHSSWTQPLTKPEVRRLIRARRSEVASADLAEADARRTSRLLAHLAPQAVVACHVSYGTEPDTSALLAELAERAWRVLLPVMVNRVEPNWAWWSGEEMTEGPAGIPQPTSPALGAEALRLADVIIMPGLAGTPQGDRLGQGGGWYDRALDHASTTAARWLLLNDAEVVPTLPTDPWDHRVSALVTERRWIESDPLRLW